MGQRGGEEGEGREREGEGEGEGREGEGRGDTWSDLCNRPENVHCKSTFFSIYWLLEIELAQLPSSIPSNTAILSSLLSATVNAALKWS
jgi:hypothetical protein